MKFVVKLFGQFYALTLGTLTNVRLRKSCCQGLISVTFLKVPFDILSDVDVLMITGFEFVLVRRFCVVFTQRKFHEGYRIVLFVDYKSCYKGFGLLLLEMPTLDVSLRLFRLTRMQSPKKSINTD